MSSIVTRAEARQSSLTAVITRADGRVEDLGMIAYHHWLAPWSWLVNAWITARRRITG